MTTESYKRHCKDYASLMKEIRRVAEALEPVAPGISNVDFWTLDVASETVRGIEFYDDLFDDEGTYKWHEFPARLLFLTDEGIKVYVNCESEVCKYLSPLASAEKFWNNRLVELCKAPRAPFVAILPKQKKDGNPLKWKKGKGNVK